MFFPFTDLTLIQECGATFTLPHVNPGCGWVQRWEGKDCGGCMERGEAALKPTFKQKEKKRCKKAFT